MLPSLIGILLRAKQRRYLFHAAIYDPLGLLGPIIFPWKLLIQDLWKKGMLWDEKLEPEEMRRCLELVKHSTNLMSWKYHDGRLKNTPTCIAQGFTKTSPRKIEGRFVMVQWSIMAGEPKENWLEDKDMEESIINVCMNMGLMEEEMPSQKVMVLIDETRFSFLLS
ncbi:unnamed protein product [Onchocerca ochengi]|uniref:DDE-1 domain-containing protein n=1 Tax=Onchocerca ochengi TaxID=42157 RepID=A0A182EQ74_ONCOC|nr:unnamed protein product [Onchocerca ochengi]